MCNLGVTFEREKKKPQNPKTPKPQMEFGKVSLFKSQLSICSHPHTFSLPPVRRDTPLALIQDVELVVVHTHGLIALPHLILIKTTLTLMGQITGSYVVPRVFPVGLDLHQPGID